MTTNRMNWGWGIAGVYLLFVGFILYLVYRSVNMKTELVSSNYYAEELNYQTHIDKLNRTQQLKEPLKWKLDAKTVNLQFPNSMNGKTKTAVIYFYCPSNSKADFKVACSTESSECIASTENLISGSYTMRIDWKCEGDEYYNEGFVNIN